MFLIKLKAMKVLVIGASGQLGHDVTNELINRKITCLTCDVVGDVNYLLDVTNYDSAFKTIKEINPDAIINCAAWTKVDDAEEIENKDKVFALNVIIPHNLALISKELSCKLMHISTDYVFDGKGETPWKPDDKNFNPLSYYGKTKLLGEKELEVLDKFFIVRIAWLFGGPVSFVNTMLKVGKTHDEVKVVNDQIGTPTYSKDLAKLLVDMIKTDKYGYYHATNEGGYISWYDFCIEIYKQAGLKTKVIPVTTAQYGLSKAIRPFNSRLDKTKLSDNGFTRLPDYKDALSRYLSEIKI